MKTLWVWVMVLTLGFAAPAWAGGGCAVSGGEVGKGAVSGEETPEGEEASEEFAAESVE